jgi:hypothetical protein
MLGDVPETMQAKRTSYLNPSLLLHQQPKYFPGNTGNNYAMLIRKKIG